MPRTLHLHADYPGDLQRAANILRDGGLVAFPTETVYGLGANAVSPKAVESIFTAKQRPAWDPLIVHVADFTQVTDVAELRDALAERTQILAAAFWPGPLTLLLPRRAVIPDGVTAGRPRVGVRMPSHPVARALLGAAGVPIAAPSANRFGHVSPTTAQHVLHDLDGRIDAVLDGGATAIGVESTVLDPTLTPMLLYRAGAVTLEMLNELGLPADIFKAATGLSEVTAASLPSPGLGMRHYAPEAQVLLAGPTLATLQREVDAALLQDFGSIGVLLPSDWPLRSEKVVVQPWGRWTEPVMLAAELFSGLRALEERGVSVILCPLPEPGGLREAIRDRLLKAARPRG